MQSDKSFTRFFACVWLFFSTNAHIHLYDYVMCNQTLDITI